VTLDEDVNFQAYDLWMKYGGKVAGGQLTGSKSP